jgi:aspartate/methionine/tyrosine aminotransferase
MMNCWPKDVVPEMMDFCQKYGLHYISDEVFANTVFDTKAEQFVSALSLLKTPEQEKDSSAKSETATEVEKKSSIEPSLVHVVWSTTKDFGACGVRAVSFKPDPFLLSFDFLVFHYVFLLSTRCR